MLYKPKDLQPATALTLRLIFLLLLSVISYRRHQVFFAHSFRPGELRQQVPAWILTLPPSQPCSNTLGALGSSEWFPPAKEHPPSPPEWGRAAWTLHKPLLPHFAAPQHHRDVHYQHPITITAGTFISMHSPLSGCVGSHRSNNF